jgi:hypothetical protein
MMRLVAAASAVVLSSILSYNVGWKNGRDDTGWKPIDFAVSAEDGSPCQYMLADPQFDAVKGKFGGNTLIIGCKGAPDFRFDTRGQKYADKIEMKENTVIVPSEEIGRWQNFAREYRLTDQPQGGPTGPHMMFTLDWH